MDTIKEMIAEDGPEICLKNYLLKTKCDIFSGQENTALSYLIVSVSCSFV